MIDKVFYITDTMMETSRKGMDVFPITVKKFRHGCTIKKMLAIAHIYLEYIKQYFIYNKKISGPINFEYIFIQNIYNKKILTSAYSGH